MPEPKPSQASPSLSGIGSGNEQAAIFDKYLMHTYQSSVRAQVKGSSQVNKTEVRALNAQEARWLLWAQFGFHSIQAGPTKLKVN